MYPRLLQFGHIAIPTYGALTALGLIAGLACAMHYARRLGLDANKVWTLCLAGILTTLAATRLLLVVSYFAAFRQHPFWVLGLTTIHAGWVTGLSLAAGCGAAMLYALAEGLPILPILDALAPAAVLGMAINRIGAFLAGMDYGLPSSQPWAVVYTSRIAALWYRTPLGIPLHPAQLYEAAAALLTLALLAWWLPRRTQPGELAGAWLFLYGFSSAALETFHAGPAEFSLVPVVAVIAGGAMWLRRTPQKTIAANA